MSPAPLRSASALPASVRTQILDASIEAAITQANAQLNGLISRLAQTLQQAGADSADPAAQAMHVAAASLLRKNRYPFAYLTAERLRAVLRHELHRAEQGRESGGETGGALRSLSLEAEADKTLCLGKTARVLEDKHGELLAMTGLRLAALFGRRQLGPARHPFRPLVFLDVLHEAWCEFQPDTAAHSLLYPLLKTDLCLDPGPILQALNKVLIKYGLVPCLHTSQPKATPSSAATPAMPHPTSKQATLPAWLDSLPPTLTRQLLDACGANGPTEAGVLRHIQRHAPRGCMSSDEAALVERLYAVFAAVLGETAIAADMRAQIAVLQLPVLRTALAQRSFSLSLDQPPCRVLELLAELAPDWDPTRDPARSDPLFRLVRRKVEHIANAPDPADAFAAAVRDLEAFVRAAQNVAEHAVAAPIAAALKAEKHRQAEKQARHQVALRVDTGELVAFVEAFLEDKWVQVLTLAYEVDDTSAQQVQNALKTMDDLAWSVKPKITAEQRRELLDMLPGMVAALNCWLDRIQWNGSERTRFFSELAACHASLMRAPLVLSPRRRLALAMDIARQAAERRLARQASRLPEPEPDEYDRHVRALRCGAWLEFAEPGGMRRLKLVWISPMRSAYVFAARARPHPLTLTDEALAAALRDGRARIVDSVGLVRQVLGANPAASANDGDRSVA